MLCIDLFSGLGGFSQAFLDNGWNVIRIDNNPAFQFISFTAIEDIMDFEFEGKVDALLASPPCHCFSVEAVHHHWQDNKPIDNETQYAIMLVKRVLNIIDEYKPTYWFIENPRAMLRKLGFMRSLPRKTITQCQYGARFQKPTDIWTNAQWNPRPMCKRGDPCHEPGPRGETNSGIQSINDSIERALIPYELSDEIRCTIENQPLKIDQMLITKIIREKT